MCGISGYFGNATQDTLERMVGSLTHRGPDATGFAYFNNGKVGLGHNRLAIIDLSFNAAQPMYNEDKSLAIVFNGEIYNFQEIRKVLEHKHKFASVSDTEVVLHAYEEWGYECLQRFNGMFSFVIYDQKNDQLFGARDRLGEKPLKYYLDDQVFLFASEVKAILKSGLVEKELDLEAINHFLTFQYVSHPLTGFKHIQKLPPASYFIYKDGKLTIIKYWELYYSHKETKPENEWIDLIHDTVKTSVEQKLISDVPLGALLSGGLDSSTVVAFMAKCLPQAVKTFSIGFEDSVFDETEKALRVSEMYGTNHTVFYAQPKDLLELLPKITQYYDEPIADNSILPTFLVCAMTRSKVTVALNGDGGDENFAGYDRYTIVKIDQLVKRLGLQNALPYLYQLSNQLDFQATTQFRERVLRYLNFANSPYFQKYPHYSSFFTNDAKHEIYHENTRDLITTRDSFNLHDSRFNQNLDLLDNALKLDIETYLPDDLLYKTDTAAMANSLELRAPLLDYKLMELTATIPSDLKLKNGVKKYIFKKMISKYNLLPQDLIYTKKRGFNVPLNSWFKGELKNYVHDSILTGQLSNIGLFDMQKLENYVAHYYQTQLNYSNNIFALILLNQWYENYFVDND
jgi:asparagine synthase (glutamine-hydrolysing)